MQSRRRTPRFYARDRFGRFDWLEDEPQSDNLDLRFLPEELAMICRAADIRGQTVSELIRMAVRQDNSYGQGITALLIRGNQNTRRLSVRCRMQDWVLVHSRAQRLGVSMSAYCADAALRFVLR